MNLVIFSNLRLNLKRFQMAYWPYCSLSFFTDLSGFLEESVRALAQCS